MTRINKLVLQGFKSFPTKVLVPFDSNFTCIAGANGSGKCITGDSLVQMADGSLIEIGKLVDEKIKTENAEKTDDGFVVKSDGKTGIISMNMDTLKLEEKPVLAFVKRKSPKSLLKIKTKSGRSITTTTYHPLFGLRDGNVAVLKADELKVGMRVAVPRSIDAKSEGKIFVELLDMITEKDNLYVPYSALLEKSARKLKKNTWNDVSKEANIPLTALNGLVDKQSIKFSYAVKLLRKAGVSDIDIIKCLKFVKSKTSGKLFKIPWENSKELARLFGYMLAEGRISENNQIWFTNSNDLLVKDYADIVRNVLGLEPSINEYKPNCWDVLIYSSPLKIIFGKLGMSLGTTKDKNVDNIFLKHSSNDELAELLNGLYCGDGYVSKNSVEIVTKSEKLAMAIFSILLRFGITPHVSDKIKIATNSGFCGKYKQVTIYGSENFEKFYENIKLKDIEKFTRLESLLGKTPNPNVDLIEANILIRNAVKELEIKVKPLRNEHPKLACYCYDGCTPSRSGIKELVDEIFSRQGMTQSVLVLDKLCNSAILWDEITSIEDANEEEWVYDLCVEKNHNFVANNIIVHNSNILDGINFVMGISSARAIRAQKLENLLFNGGMSRTPAQFAYVAMYLDNKDKRIPIDAEEVKISRKVSRAGVSIYKVNGVTENKTRVVELLSYVGLSPEGHNIIMQGDVTNVIEMSTKERRLIIDEISGISEFDEKKEKTGKELQQVDTRVRELMIIVTEKEKTVEKLKAEKEAAEKYLVLEGKLNRARASLASKRLENVTKRLKTLEEEIEKQMTEYKKMDSDFNKMDINLEKEEKEISELSKKIIEKSVNASVKKTDEIRVNLIRKKDKLDSNLNDINRMQGMVSDLHVLDAYSTNMAVKAVIDGGKQGELQGVYGTVASLISTQPKYEIAIEVALARHGDDIIVATEDVAIRCIKFLKSHELGRARFIPLDKVRPHHADANGKGVIDVAVNLVRYDRKYDNAMQFLLGGTLVIDKIDNVKGLSCRAVTLDGDMKEESGLLIGGFYKKRSHAPTGKGGIDYEKEIIKLEQENEQLENEIAELEDEMAKIKDEEKGESDEVKKLHKQLDEKQKNLEQIRLGRKGQFDKRSVLQSTLNEKKIERAKVEAEFDNTKKDYDEIMKTMKTKISMMDDPAEELEKLVRETVIEMNHLGPVNMRAIDEYKTLNVEFSEMRTKLDKLIQEKEAIEKVVAEIEKNRYTKFMETMNVISMNFGKIYYDMMQGSARLRLEEEKNIESGLVLEANPKGKKILNLDAMSGGEKTMTALAFLFAIMQYYSAPFYILDEIDAALDKVNTRKVDILIQNYSKTVQFIVITHNDATIASADNVVGVSMDQGVSKIIGIDLKHGIHNEGPAIPLDRD